LSQGAEPGSQTTKRSAKENQKCTFFILIHPKSSLLIFLHLPILYFSIFAEPPGQKNANAASRYQFFTSGLAMTSKSKASVAETGSRSVASEC
jgi:hypothetical protein